MKRLATLIMLLLPILSSGQQLPVINNGNKDDIYATRKESGELILFFQIYDWNHSGDELYVVLDRQGCEEMQEFLRKTSDTFRRLEDTAENEHIAGYRKRMDIEPPVFFIQWREQGEGWRRIPGEEKLDAASFNPVFEVSKDGMCYVTFMMKAISGENEHEAKMRILSDRDFRRNIKRFDYRKSERLYYRLHQLQ